MARYDVAATLARVTVPTLAIWGELDNHRIPEDKAGWEAGFRASKHVAASLITLPKANHVMLEADTGSSAETPRLNTFVPEYSRTILDWLRSRVRLSN